MPIETALALLAMIAAIIAAVQEGNDRAIKSTAIVVALLEAMAAARAYVDFFEDHLYGVLWMVVTGTAAVGALILVIKLKNRVVGTCAICGAGLLALMAMEAIRT
ncbi:MAG: hypothetical protein ACOCYP_10580 [Planctomycetota bacterium]